MTALTPDPTLRLRRRTERVGLRAETHPAGNRFDREYWLRHCEGYRVDGVEGRLGFVDSIREEADGAALLAVRAGRLGRRLLLVRARDVAFIVPRAERIWLSAPTTIVRSETG
jgi:hypothetical protein